MQPEDRLREAIKQVGIVREEARQPDQDSMLAWVEYYLRGVADEIEERRMDEGEGL